MDLSKYIDLFPDIYDKSTAPSASNIRKIMEVIADQFADIVATAEANRLIKLLANASGKVLDLIGADYKLLRYGKNDEQYRAFILAKIYGRITGNGVDKVLSYFSFFINSGNIRLLPLTHPEILNPILKGLQIHRAFTVEVDNIDTVQEDILTQALAFLKGAGIYATINFTKKFNPLTDLPGISWQTQSIPSKVWWSATVQTGNSRKVLASENKPSTGSDQRLDGTNGEWFNVVNVGVSGLITTAGRSYLSDIFRDGTRYVFSFYQSNTAVAINNQTYFSTDGGNSWATEGTHATKYARLIYVSGTRRIAHLFNNNQLSMSNNSGSSWTDANLPHANTVFAFPADSFGVKKEFIYNFNGVLMIPARTTGNHLYVARSTDSGGSWSSVTLANPSSEIVYMLSGNGSTGFLMAPTSSGLYRSTDNGLNWSFATWASYGLTMTGGIILTEFVTGSTFLYYKIGSGSAPIIARSTNNGIAITEQTLPDTISGDYISRVWRVGSLIFVGVQNPTLSGSNLLHSGKLYVSSDDGATYSLKFTYQGESQMVLDRIEQYGSDFLIQVDRTMVMRYTPEGARFLNGDLWTLENQTESAGTRHDYIFSSAELLRVRLDQTQPLVSTGSFAVFRAANNMASETGDAIIELDEKQSSLRLINLTQNQWARVHRNDNQIVAVSAERHGAVAFSNDAGATWYAGRFSSPKSRMFRVRGVTYFNNQWYVIGQSAAFTTNHILSSSSNGIDWVRVAGSVSSGVADYVCTTSDRIFWAQRAASEVARFDGVSLAVSSAGIPIYGLGTSNGILYAGGTVSGNAGYAFSSNKGVSWSTVNSGIAFTPIAFAVGVSGIRIWINAAGNIIWTADGITFTQVSAAIPAKNWRALTNQGNNFAAFSTDGPVSFASSKLLLP